MSLNIFSAISDLAIGARLRRKAEDGEFLKFYRSIVETVSPEVVSIFGHMPNVHVVSNGKKEEWGIELTATDFIWWKSKLESGDVRFVEGGNAIKAAMLHRMARMAEVEKLSADERKRLISLLEDSDVE